MLKNRRPLAEFFSSLLQAILRGGVLDEQDGSRRMMTPKIAAIPTRNRLIAGTDLP